MFFICKIEKNTENEILNKAQLSLYNLDKINQQKLQ